MNNFSTNSLIRTRTSVASTAEVTRRHDLLDIEYPRRIHDHEPAKPLYKSSGSSIAPGTTPAGSVSEGTSLSLEQRTLLPGESLQYTNSPLHDSWTNWILTQDWQWFVTVTYKVEIHPEAADKLYRVWINKLNRTVYGRNWQKKKTVGVKHVRALEWQKRGVLHYHALIANIGMQTRGRWSTVWDELARNSKAGFILIKPYDEMKGGAAEYLSKYVSKGGEIDLSINFRSVPINPTVDHNEIRKLQSKF